MAKNISDLQQEIVAYILADIDDELPVEDLRVLYNFSLDEELFNLLFEFVWS